MDVVSWMPFWILMSSVVPGVVIFFLSDRHRGLRTALNMGGVTLKLILIGFMIAGLVKEQNYLFRLPLLPGMDLVLHADTMSVLIVALSGVLWFVTTLYAIAYLEGSPQPRSRFFGFFSLCVSATIGIALSGNLITFLIFYELLTLSTYPLVVHQGTPKALRAGKIYLAYTLTGGASLLIGVAWLRAIVGPLEFVQGGILSTWPAEYHNAFRAIFFFLIAGLGVKAAIVPLHGWLPNAMVAPAPVSALLHAVAVVKAGAFGIVRVVYDVFGIEFAAQLGLLAPMAAVAAVTIIWGSVRALSQDNLKKRLAFSTVSQVSYITLGAGILGPIATIGGVVHLVHQGLMKITLFFCAGNLVETIGVHRVSEMNGVGRRMPLTMAAFTVGALGMIGVPPIAGFVSKWYLGAGSAAAGADWVIGVLAASSLLNAMYFLPILHRAWFREPDGKWAPTAASHRLETHWMLLVPPVLTALLSLLAGLLADAPFSPLEWARRIAEKEYLP